MEAVLREGRSPGWAECGYHSLFLRAPEAILIMDRKGRFMDANLAASSMLGYSRASLLRMRFRDLNREHFDRWGGKVWRVLSAMGEAAGEWPLFLKGRKKIKVNFSAVSIKEGIFACFLTDATERKQAAQARQSELAIAQRRETAGAMAAGLAHDLNGLGIDLLGHLSLLNRQIPRRHRGRESLKSIREIVGRGRRLARQLLSFVRNQQARRRRLERLLP